MVVDFEVIKVVIVLFDVEVALVSKVFLEVLKEVMVVFEVMVLLVSIVLFVVL